MRYLLLLTLFSLSASAQRFSLTDSTFGGVSRPAFTFMENGFVAADEDRDSLGLLQVGLFDSIGNKVFHKSFDYYESSDSVLRVFSCFKCFKSIGNGFLHAQTDYIRADSGFVRFTRFTYMSSIDVGWIKKKE